MQAIIKAAYFGLERASLLGDEALFSTYKGILVSYHKQGLLKSSLTEYQKRNLKFMARPDSAGTLPFPPKSALPSSPISIDKSPESEKELSDLILYHGMKTLGAALGERVVPRMREQETKYSEDLGYVDLVCESENGKTMYVCEFKLGRGERGILDQILEYRTHYILLLSSGIFEAVIGVTLCSKYDPFTRDKLREEGILILRYEATNKLHIERV